MTDKKAIEIVDKLVKYCEEQRECQNCVFRKYGCDHWNCHLNTFDMREVKANYEAKRKNNGYI